MEIVVAFIEKKTAKEETIEKEITEKEADAMDAEKDEAQKEQAQEKQTMVDLESEKTPVQKPHWADSPPAEENVPQEIEEIDLTKFSPSELEEAQSPTSVSNSEVAQLMTEVANLKNACLSAFQLLPLFVTSTIKANIDDSFREKTNMDLYFSSLRHKEIKVEVLQKIIKSENKLTTEVHEYIVKSKQEVKDQIEGQLNQVLFKREVILVGKMKKSYAEKRTSQTEEIKKLIEGMHNKFKKIEATQKKQAEFLSQKAGSFRNKALHQIK